MIRTLYTPCLICTLFLFGCSVQTVSAQYKKREVIEMKSRAEDYFENHQFFQALEIFRKLEEVEPDNPDVYYHIGVCLIELEDLRAIPYLERAYEEKNKFPEILNYFLGAAYHLNHDFEKAIAHYNEFLAFVHQQRKSQKHYRFINDIEREIQMCKTGIKLTEKAVDIEIVNLSDKINSPYPDYAPVISADEKVMIFTSERPNTTGGHIDKFDRTYNEDIYISYKDESGNWTSPAQMSNVNTEGQDASVGLSSDGQTLLLYRYNTDHIIERSSGDLYISKLEGDHWGEPQLLPQQINSSGWESGASLAENGDIYFCSNRKGGIGHSDIYIARKLPDGGYSEAQNLQIPINTAHDEVSPFLHPDGKTLYFCSDGHNSIGGFDIFVSEWDESTDNWGEPTNLGYPINTAHDDIHYFLSADGTRIYFSSKREDSKGDKDIYYATIKEEKHKLIVMKGTVQDSVTKTPVRASIVVRDKESKELVGVYNSNSASGKYIVIFTEGRKYDISIEAQGYEFCNETIDTESLEEYEEYNRDILLCPQPQEE